MKIMTIVRALFSEMARQLSGQYESLAEQSAPAAGSWLSEKTLA